MEDLESIEPYSWWTLWNPQVKPNMLTYKAGQLTPAGKGYMNPGDELVDCEYPGTKIDANQATLNGTALHIQCGSGVPLMIKDIGNDGGTATLTVNVDGNASHAMNVAFVTAVDRNLSVSVNNGEPVQFSFIDSGEWCGNGGQSTVLPIELNDFVNGQNTIVFGNSSQNEPIIEGFSIVDHSWFV